MARQSGRMKEEGQAEKAETETTKARIAGLSDERTQTFLKINEPLVPPKPNELHSVYSRPLT